MKKRKGIIERLVMGKPREKDLTEADLPSTRTKQFRFVFKTRFGIIFRANLLAALFCVPYIMWELLSGAYITNFVKGMEAAEHVSYLLYLTLLQYGTEIPLLMLSFVGLAGAYYVVRRICWGQSVKIVADFGRGIKQSWLQFMLLGLLTGIVSLLINYAVNLALLTMGGNNALVWGLGLTAILLFAVLYSIIVMFAMCQSTLYNLSFARLLYNSTVLTFKRLFRSLLICLASLAPILVLVLMPWVFVKIVGYSLVVVFSIGFAVTLQTVYCHGVFDTFINAKDYPDFVGMGLAGAKLPEELLGESADDMAENTVEEQSEQLEQPEQPDNEDNE